VKVLFLDESGDHNLSMIDPQYPLFVLGGVIVDQEYAEGELTNQLNAFKRGLFARTDIVLHTAEITRNRGIFEHLKDASFRSRFYDALNDLMRRPQDSRNAIYPGARRTVGLNLRTKHDNVAGLQLADLVVSPIGRHVLGKPDKEDWRIVEAKFRRSPDGRMEGFGLVVLPR
jgi:hypothetical protein